MDGVENWISAIASCFLHEVSKVTEIVIGYLVVVDGGLLISHLGGIPTHQDLGDGSSTGNASKEARYSHTSKKVTSL